MIIRKIEDLENVFSNQKFKINVYLAGDRKLKLINSFPVQQVRDKNFKERKLLDIGCGTGDFLKKAKDNDWIVSGIEPNEKARKIANSKTNNSV